MTNLQLDVLDGSDIDIHEVQELLLLCAEHMREILRFIELEHCGTDVHEMIW